MAQSMMGDERLIYSILDLLKDDEHGEGLTGTIADIQLYRDHPLDEYIVTSADFYYKNGVTAELQLSYGSEDVSTYPKAVRDKPYHRDYKHCQHYRLTHVGVVYYKEQHNPIHTQHLQLHYDDMGLLSRTEIEVY